MNKALFLALTAASALSPTLAAAANNECQIEKYDNYINASIHWYEDLSELTSSSNPDLKEVSDWFLDGRKKHFELNRVAVSTFLTEQPTKVSTELDVESWLQLSQQDVKALAERDDQLGQLAKASFEYRQAKPHPQNYEFRSALAELLSHPNKIQPALDAYNKSVMQANETDCK